MRPVLFSQASWRGLGVTDPGGWPGGWVRCVFRGSSLSSEKESAPALRDLGVGGVDSEIRTHMGRVGIRLGQGWGPGGRALGLGGLE